MGKRNTHPRKLILASATLVLCGMLLFVYGIFAPSPALPAGMHAAAMPGTPSQELFLIASILIITGVTLDVWRKLHVLHAGEHHPVRLMSFDRINHDPVLEEPHIW